MRKKYNPNKLRLAYYDYEPDEQPDKQPDDCKDRTYMPDLESGESPAYRSNQTPTQSARDIQILKQNQMLSRFPIALA